MHTLKGTVRNMLLAIDVGNTQTVLGIYDNDKLVHMWRVATNVDHTSAELRDVYKRQLVRFLIRMTLRVEATKTPIRLAYRVLVA